MQWISKDVHTRSLPWLNFDGQMLRQNLVNKNYRIIRENCNCKFIRWPPIAKVPSAWVNSARETFKGSGLVTESFY